MLTATPFRKKFLGKCPPLSILSRLRLPPPGEENATDASLGHSGQANKRIMKSPVSPGSAGRGLQRAALRVQLLRETGPGLVREPVQSPTRGWGVVNFWLTPRPYLPQNEKAVRAVLALGCLTSVM